MKTQKSLYEEYGEGLIGRKVSISSHFNNDKEPYSGCEVISIIKTIGGVRLKVKLGVDDAAINLPASYLVQLDDAGLEEEISSILNQTYNI